jgi:predicted DNA-binding protein (UPF0278 family)
VAHEYVRYIQLSKKNKKGKRTAEKHLAEFSAMTPALQSMVARENVKNVVINFLDGTSNIFELDRDE